MTIDISNNDPRISYSVAQGVTQTSFAIPFEFFDDSDVNVYVDGTLKTITTDYTISGGAGSTGTLNISVTGGAGGSTVVLTRDITIERTTDFTAGADINRAALNTQLDTLTGIAADIKDATTLALRYNDQTVGVSTEMPVVDTLKGNVLAFNITTGAPEAGPSISEVSSAQTYATNAATSETNAAASATSASTSATNAATSATNAATSETNAASSETAAGASETNAATSATNAASSASSASSSASAAASSASAAATSETNAATSATNAASSASSASSAQTAAEAARDATLAAYDNFDDRYLGAKSSDPTLDNDGNALIAGALYFNTVAEEMRLYTGSAWVAAYVSGSGFLASSNNLSDLTNAATARQNLGVEIGVDIQAYDATLLNDADIGVTVQAYDATILNNADIGVSVQAYDADTAKLDVAQNFTAAQRGSTDTDTTNTGNVTLDFATNQNFVLTLTGNVTLDNPTTEAVGQSGFIVFIQDGTGGRTVSLGTDYETAGGAGLTLSSAASATDVVPYIVAASGRILLGAPQLAFA